MARYKHRHSYRSSKNIIGKTMQQSVVVAKNTSKKIMPKVKTGLESVGSNVIRMAGKSIPLLQQMTRKLFGLFSKSRKTRRR